MQVNVGNPDRIARIVVGLMLLSLPFRLDSSWRRRVAVPGHGETGRWPENSLAGPQ